VASAFARGPKSAPRYFARFLDTSGVWRSRRVRVDKRADALRAARKFEADAERVRLGLEAPASSRTTMAELLDRWTLQLRNRSFRNDVSRVRVHLRPYWGVVRVADVTLPRVLGYLEHLRASTLAPGTQRGLLGVLSRAMAFAVSQGLAPHNVCRNVPAQARPVGAPPTAVRWIDDDETPRAIMRTLPEPFALAWYVCFGTGCRQGEAFGLTMGDLDELDAGCIRLAHSWRGVLKEAKASNPGKEKYVPAPADAPAVLAPWLERRRAEGAGPDDLVFPGIVAYQVSYAWARACRTLGLDGLTWHHATRTSFASRAAARGVPLEAISQALGHASTAMVARTYMRFVRRTFDPRLRAGLAPMPPAAKVLPIAGARASGAAFDDSAVTTASATAANDATSSERQVHHG
jgi:integrase